MKQIENTAETSSDERQTPPDIEREDHKRAGHVSHDEAKKILVRFCNSHFRNHERDAKHERARMSIPADPRRDDDIRLSAYIAQQQRSEAEAARTIAELDVKATNLAVDVQRFKYEQTVLHGILARVASALKDIASDSDKDRDGNVVDLAWCAQRAAAVLPELTRAVPGHSLMTTVDAFAKSEERAATAEAARASIEKLLNTPELHRFAEAVTREAAHQRARWGSAHDAGKTPSDWFWLIGYVGGKALRSALAGELDKALHHVITTAAVAANWHAALLGQTDMRPGLSAEAVAEVSDG